MSLRTIVSIAAAAAGLSLAAAASAAVTFQGPDGWHHSAQPSADGKVQIDQWKLSGDPPQSVTVIQDTGTTYADALSAVTTNFSTNHIKPSIDKDQTCIGRASHVFEYTFGPDGNQSTVNRLVVPDGTGVVTITYARGSKDDFDSDVRKSITTFCAGTGT
jgi:hypothetical protein